MYFTIEYFSTSSRPKPREQKNTQYSIKKYSIALDYRLYMYVIIDLRFIFTIIWEINK